MLAVRIFTLLPAELYHSVPDKSIKSANIALNIMKQSVNFALNTAIYMCNILSYKFSPCRKCRRNAPRRSALMLGKALILGMSVLGVRGFSK